MLANAAPPRDERDAITMGEVMLRGNVVLKGYLKNKTSTDKAFEGGWLHSGDPGVRRTDGYMQLKDRSKDVTATGEAQKFAPGARARGERTS